MDDLLADPTEVGTKLDQDLRGNTFTLADEAEQDVLCTDVVVAELQGFPEGELKHLLGARRKGDVPGGAWRPWPMISCTCSRTPSSEMLIDSSALAATPSPSWISPNRMCSVPM
ncbi:hypothetical protein AHiyo8_05960 [Arthrobacter sp. Hiyo8]|nr:hypothetical protein AHiyo8_05960 [Arthrobacter sp. Hiyo8]